MAGATLTYRDANEGLRVEVFDDVLPSVAQITVFRHGVLVSVAYCSSFENAQNLAQLLMGIEIQKNGAAWKRGPRAPARPTDASGKIIQQRRGS